MFDSGIRRWVPRIWISYKLPDTVLLIWDYTLQTMVGKEGAQFFLHPVPVKNIVVGDFLNPKFS
jgi:hypothetical protein